MACSSSCSPSDFELQLVARAGLQSLHSFISHFSPASSSSSSSLQPQLQEQQRRQQSMAAATDTIINFKHLSTLLSHRKGHARVRQAPCIAAAPSSHPNILSPIKPNSPLVGNPNFSPSASESFQFSQIGLPAGSYTSFEECDSANFVDDGHSMRGSSNIDLNNQINDNSDYYEGSINTFSRRGYNYIEHIKAKDNCPYNNTHNSYAFSSNIVNDNNPSSLIDLNQQAPSLEYSSSSLTSSLHIPPNCLESKYNYTLPSSPPFYCPQPILAFPPPSHEEFSFDARTQSAATPTFATPSASNNPSVPSSDDEFRRTDDNNPTTLYGGHNLTRQLAQIISTNPNFEANLEKAACMISKPTHSHISCISLEGNLPTNGSVPPVQKPQPAVGSILDQKGISAVKRKCPSNADDSKLTKCGNSSSKCHCAKSRKLKNKSIKKVPAISDKISEIPYDDYSWRKYGQKPIKGSPYPRGYYKCSGVKGCPAKKHVERALDDPSMLIITYEGEHIHSKPILEEPCKYEGPSLIN